VRRETALQSDMFKGLLLCYDGSRRDAGRSAWSGPQQRASLAERVGCCAFVAVNAENEA